ncbi:MAG: hypothetical protein J7K77_03865 [Dehalococcoidales bacterium]|nr:hypothetical protein [Dehalococcoidales bacterium]
MEQIFSIPLPVLMGNANFRENYHPTEDKSGLDHAYKHEDHTTWELQLEL